MAVGIKKFVAIVLVVSIVSLVPLQALAQVEPRMTYGEWCVRLQDLNSQLDKRISAERTIRLSGGTVWTGLAGCLGLMYASVAVSFADNFAAINSAIDVMEISVLLLAISLTWGVFDTVASLKRIAQSRELSDEQGIPSIEELRATIDLLVTAGANRMWFYPCE